MTALAKFAKNKLMSLLILH